MVNLWLIIGITIYLIYIYTYRYTIWLCQNSYGKIHHAINGKIHYFYGHFFNSYVKLPEGRVNS